MPAISGPLTMSERRVALGALAVQIGNQAILAAFDDVVGQTSIERQVRAVLLAFFGLAEVLGDGRDVNWLSDAFSSALCCRQSSGAARSNSSSASTPAR